MKNIDISMFFIPDTVAQTNGTICGGKLEEYFRTTWENIEENLQHLGKSQILHQWENFRKKLNFAPKGVAG